MALSLSHSLALGRLPIIMGPCEVRRHRQAPYPLQTRLAPRHCSVQQVSSTGGVNVFEQISSHLSLFVKETQVSQ